MMKRLAFALVWCMGLSASLWAADPTRLTSIEGAEAGLVVLVEPAGPGLAVKIAGGGRHVVAALSADARQVGALDDAFAAAKVHPVADAHLWHTPATLPFRDHAVNVLVLDPATAKQITEAEVQRVIAPGYGVGLIKTGDQWKEVRKPRPEGMDVWLGWYSHGGGHMANEDLLAQPPNSVQFIGGPRSLRRMPFLATQRVLMVNQMARDAFTGVIRWMGPVNTSVEFGGGDLSDGKHLLRVQGIDDDRLPVLDILTGSPIHSGIVLGEVERTGPVGSKEPPFAWREICADGERLYWRGKLKSVRAAHIVKNQRLWEKEFARSVEAIVTDGKVVGVLLVENRERKHEGVWSRHNVATEVVGLDAASGKELWRSEEFAGRMTQHFGMDHGVVVAATDLVGPNPDPPGNQYKEQARVRDMRRPGNCMVAFDAATGSLVFKRTEFQDITTLGGRKSFGLLPGRIVIMSDEDYVSQFDMKTGKTIGPSLLTNAGGVDGMRAYRAQHYSMTPNWLIHQALGGIDWTGKPSVHRHAPKLQTVWYDSRVFPANGMMYFPPRLASTHADAGVNPALAMIARQAPSPLPDAKRLLIAGRAEGATSPARGDWPTFRGTFERTAWSAIDGPAAPKLAWEARLSFAKVPEAARLLEQCWRFNSSVPGPVTQPVADGQRVLVAVPDAHRVDCLNLANGKLMWSARLGGRITSPPTLAGGVAFVGCNDGTINAVNLADGKVIWSFLAARNGDLLMAFDQVESLAPVPSTPVVIGDTVYVTAGRHSLMEDGIALYALDAASGAIRAQTMLDLKTFEAKYGMVERTELSPAATHKQEAMHGHHGMSPLQMVDGMLRYGPWLIDPKSLAVQTENRGTPGSPGQRAVPSDYDRRAPVPWRGDHAGGMGWIKPVDQWGGYRHPLPQAGAGPDSGFSVLAIRADGLAVVGDHAKKSSDLQVIPLEGSPTQVAANLKQFKALHTMAGAGDRVYLAGSAGRKMLLLTVNLSTSESLVTEVPAVVPSDLRLITDGMPYTTATHAHPSAAMLPDHEYIIPDGIAIAHGYVIVTTTAGRVLAFK